MRALSACFAAVIEFMVVVESLLNLSMTGILFNHIVVYLLFVLSQEVVHWAVPSLCVSRSQMSSISEMGDNVLTDRNAMPSEWSVPGSDSVKTVKKSTFSYYPTWKGKHETTAAEVNQKSIGILLNIKRRVLSIKYFILSINLANRISFFR